MVEQLPSEYKELNMQLILARRTWQLFGLSLIDLRKMDDYDLAMIRVAIGE